MVLGGLTVVAAVLRAIHLDSGLWLDEITTLVDFVRPPLAQTVTAYTRNNHPLYSVLAHASIQWLGDHPWTLRLPAAVFGIVSIPMIHALGAALGSPREGLLSAGVLAVAYHHVWFSQDARGYTAVAFWAMLASLLLLRSVRDGGVRWAVAYGVAGALGLYTHLVMGFVILAHVLGWLWLMVRPAAGVPRDAVRRPAIGFALAGAGAVLLHAPMVLPLFTELRRPQALAVIATPAWALRETVGGFQVGFGAWGAALAALLFGAGLRDGWRRARWAVVTLVVLPAALLAASIPVLSLPAQPRYFFVLAGIGVVVLVRGAMVLGRWLAGLTRPQHATAWGVALVGVVIAANALALPRLYRLPKQDFDGALQYVETRRAPGDTVVTAGLAVVPYRSYYGKPWLDVETSGEAARLRSAGHRLWMVYSGPSFMQADLVAWLGRECRSAMVFPGTLSGGDVVVCAL